MAQYRDHIDKELFERIEAYLLNNMDAGTRAAFEQEMQADISLRNEVVLQQKLTGAAAALSHEYENLLRTTIPATDPVKKLNRNWWYAAAAVVILVLATWLFRHNSNSPEKLFATYFKPDAGLPVVMSGTNEAYDFYNGMVSYKEGDYAKALDIWQNVKTASDTLAYYRAVAQLNNNHLQQAVDGLLPVAQNSNSQWQPKAIWYLALAYLKQNNRTQALVWLNKIPGNKEALRLVNDIHTLSP